MKNVGLKPHSVVDWDFTAGTCKQLTPVLFVSPPSSLWVRQTGGCAVRPAILCRIPATRCIAEGEVRTWHYTGNRTRDFRLIFRNQHALGGADYEDTYYWALTGDWAYLYRVIGGALVAIDHFPIAFGNNEQNHWRALYWNGKNDLGEDALSTELYKQVAGDWVQQGTTLYDTLNQWKDSAINRSGIGCWVDGVNYHLFDDTEIWAAE